MHILLNLNFVLQDLVQGRQFEVTFENMYQGKVKQMQQVWVWLLWSKFFEVSYEITQWRKVKQMQPVHNVYIGQFFSFRPRAVGHIVQPRDRHIIEHIWKYTLEKSRTNATSVSLAAMIQVLWGLIWNYTVEKSQTNATSATTFPLKQSIWGHI